MNEPLLFYTSIEYAVIVLPPLLGALHVILTFVLSNTAVIGVAIELGTEAALILIGSEYDPQPNLFLNLYLNM